MINSGNRANDEGGVTGVLFKSIDWSKSPIGEPAEWPPVLKMALKILFHSKQPMFIWWGRELIQFYNDAYLPSFGEGKHPEAMGQKGEECWREVWPIIGPQIKAVMERGESTWKENQLIPIFRNGRLEDVWWTYGYSPIFNLDDSVGGTLVTCTEVTMQMSAERTLKAEREKLYSLFMQAPMPICTLEGPEHRFTLANSAYCEFADRDVVGRTVREVFTEEEAGPFFTILDEVYSSGRPFIGKEMLISLKERDGSPRDRYLNFDYHPTRDAFGGIEGIIALVQDVTEQVSARKEVEMSEAHFRNLANLIPQLAWMAEPNGSIYWYNDNWYSYSGTKPEDMAGWRWQSLHNPEILPTVIERWSHSIATGEMFEMTFPLKGADGNFRWFLTRVNPLKDAEGKVVRWFGTNTDVHQQKSELSNLEKEKVLREQFVNTLTHDLKNPLAAAKISAQFIDRSRQSPEKLASLTGRIVDNLSRADQMINNLLDANRIKAGEPLNFEMKEVGLVSLVTDLLGKLSTTHGDRFVLEIEDPIINGVWNADALCRVVENLCANAIKYGDKISPIRVRLEQEGDEVMLAVHNKGSAIAPSDLPLLFDPYQRATQNSGIQGWGLGLTLAKGFTEAHGGTISVSSNVNEGTTFKVILPKDSRSLQ